MLLALSGGRIGLAGSIYCGWCILVQYSSHYGLVSLGAKNAVIGACGTYIGGCAVDHGAERLEAVGVPGREVSFSRVAGSCGAVYAK